MKKNYKTNLSKFLVLLLISISFIITGCSDDDKSTTDTGTEIIQEVNIGFDYIGSWDYYEIEIEDSISAVRDYPVPIQENYLYISKPEIRLAGEAIGDENSTIYMLDNQIWYEGSDLIKHYLYDFYYENDMLLLHEETTDALVWNYNPSVEDSLNENIDDGGFLLFYRHLNGPKLELISPEDAVTIPDLDISDIETLAITFRWDDFFEGQNYRLQVRKDTLFNSTDTTTFVINTITDGNIGGWPGYEMQENLENFSTFYWRARSDYSAWSNIRFFRTNYVVELTAPAENAQTTRKPIFDWEEYDGASNYTLQVSSDISFENPEVEITGLTETTLDFIDYPNYTLETVRHYWRVKADNSQEQWSEIIPFNVNKKVGLVYPTENQTELPTDLTLQWSPIVNASSYDIVIATDSLFTDEIFSTTISDGEVGSFDVQLEPNSSYAWRVQSDVSFGWSKHATFFTNRGVINLFPSDESEDKVYSLIEFKWSEYQHADYASDPATYDLQVSQNNDFSNLLIDAQGIVDTIYCANYDFEFESTYFWRVKDNNGDWENANEVEFTIEPAFDDVDQDLNNPQDGFIGLSSRPALRWYAFSGADLYRLQVATDENFNNLFLDYITGDESFIFSDTDVANDEYGNVDSLSLLFNETYYWRVSPANSSRWSDIWSFVVDDGKPGDLTLQAKSNYKIDISWDNVSSSYDGYQVYRKTDLTGWEAISAFEVDFDTEFADFNLEKGITYYYKMRGFQEIESSLQIDEADTVYIEMSDETLNVNFGPFTNEVSIITANDPDYTEIETEIVTNGNFIMGDDSSLETDEAPQHTVTISNDFEMATYEITNEQFCQFLNYLLGKKKLLPGVTSYGGDFYSESLINFPNNNVDGAIKISDILLYVTNEEDCKIRFNIDDKCFEPISAIYADKPVVNVKYKGAWRFANWYSTMHNLTELHDNSNVDFVSSGYRLPTEAEWEYAAKGGNSSAGYVYSGSNTSTDVGYSFANASTSEHSVGELQPNELGLYDMSGNVWEWCLDKYAVDYYTTDAVTDPSGPNSGSKQVIRGGSWEMSEYELRNINRSSCKPDLSYLGKINSMIGFRIIKQN